MLSSSVQEPPGYAIGDILLNPVQVSGLELEII